MLRHEFLQRSAQASVDSSDDEAMEPTSTKENEPNNWQTYDDVPHVELAKRMLLIRPPNSDSTDKALQVPVLELKCAQGHLAIIREVMLQMKLAVRTFGIFIPPSFFNEEPTAVYNTAVRHMQFINRLKMIPVSGIHSNVMDLKIPTDDGPHQSFYQFIYNTKETSAAGTTATYLFASIEPTHLTSKTGKWYFLTTEENYPAAVQFIDNQLPEKYRQAEFHRLEYTRKIPFSRGPHRLTKLSEAASQHAHHLKAHVITGNIPKKVPAPRKSPHHV